MWGWIASLVIVLLPLYESFDGLLQVISCAKPTGATKENVTV